ncbi:MAG: glutathione S-transferase [Gammaproteobacteria bacterium]|jgi:glutathione S-transferase
MSELELIIGNKNYSSWSLRAWIWMRHLDIEFKETVVPLDLPETSQTLQKWFSGNKVPLLLADGHQIWDSMAILEFISRLNPKQAEPDDSIAAGVMRSLCAEMHSGFFALRAELPMNCRREIAKIDISEDCQLDISRIESLWQHARQYSDQKDEFLFGRYSMADAMFAPIVWRLHVYAIELSENTHKYISHCLKHPAMQEWLEAARQEPWIIAAEEC